MKALRATALVTFLVCIVAACGGHATTNTSVLGASARPGTIPVTVTVDISHGKNASSAQRTVKYVSPYAVSLAINTSKFGYPSPIPSPLPSPGYFPYGNSAADCTATQCSLTLSLDPGYYRFALSLYDGKTQTGAVVQTATAYGFVATGVANAINVTLDPTVSSVALISSTPLPFANGLPAKATVNVQFLDGGGHIVPPQVLPSYVFASATAPPGAVSVTPSYLLASDLIAGKAFTISYTGAEQPAGTPVTIAVQTTNLQIGGSSAPPPSLLSFTFAAPPAFTQPSAPGNEAPMQSIGNTVEGALASGSGNGIVALVSFNDQTTTAPTVLPTGSITVEARSGSSTFAVHRRTANVSVHDIPHVSLAMGGFADDVIPDPNLARAPRLPMEHVRKAQSLATPPPIGTKKPYNALIFPIDGSAAGTSVPITLTLRASGPHSLIWVDDAGTITDSATTTTISSMEAAYRSDTTYYGLTTYDESAIGNFLTPVCDSTGAATTTIAPYYATGIRTDIINVIVLSTAHLGAGVGGYFSSSQMRSQGAANCDKGGPSPSMEGPTIVFGLFGGSVFEGGLAHELQHLIHFVNHSLIYGGAYDPSYIDEGMAGLASELSSSPQFSGTQIPTTASNVSLFLWRGNENGHIGSGCGACYATGYLFIKYLSDRFGVGILSRLTQTGRGNFDNLAQASGVADGRDLVRDFYGMLAVSGNPSDNDPRYAFHGGTLVAPGTSGTIAIDGGPVTFTQFYQGSAVFLNVSGAMAAVVRAHDDSGSLLLRGVTTRR